MGIFIFDVQFLTHNFSNNNYYLHIISRASLTYLFFYTNIGTSLE